MRLQNNYIKERFEMAEASKFDICEDLEEEFPNVWALSDEDIIILISTCKKYVDPIERYSKVCKMIEYIKASELFFVYSYD